MGQAAVYAIRNLVNGKAYVGSSVNYRNRWYQHRRELEAGTHNNTHLKRAWKKYGAESFVFEVLEILDGTKPDEMIRREQYHIDQRKATDPRYGYNKRPHASSNVGLRFSEEHKANLSASQRERLRSRNEEQKAKHKANLSLAQRRCADLRAKSYRLLSPDGELAEGVNIRKFCRERGLVRNCLSAVLKGKALQHKGWKLPSDES